VAPGIAEALVATAIGLFAAIPAVIAYNRFSPMTSTASRCASRASWKSSPTSCSGRWSMRQRRLLNEINVVPYIDVMLVLLVIFMVTHR
jgi:hypothetical protein